jgi:spore germination protein GerM
LQRGKNLIHSRSPWARAWTAALVAVIVAAGCARHVTVPQPHKLTIYYCKAGSDDLVRVPFTVDPKLSGNALVSYALNQQLAGPSVGRDSFVLFPAGTTASATTQGDLAIVDLNGSVVRSFQSGAGDEVGMFKSLTFTLTGLPGIKSVQVLVAGQKQAALAGGHFEIDEPLTRDTFAQ